MRLKSYDAGAAQLFEHGIRQKNAALRPGDYRALLDVGGLQRVACATALRTLLYLVRVSPKSLLYRCLNFGQIRVASALLASW